MKNLLLPIFFAALAFMALSGCDDGDTASSAGQDQADDDDDNLAADDDNGGADDDDNDNDDSDDDDNDNDDSTDDDSTDEPVREWFYDEQGRVAIYHGVQIIQQRDPYISWHTEADYDRLVEWGSTPSGSASSGPR